MTDSKGPSYSQPRDLEARGDHPRGIFITFEGGEGAGKSTQIARLKMRLESEGVAVTTTREPGGTAFAEAARGLLLDPATAPKTALGQALLVAAARAEHLDGLIRPALASGSWVLSDRFADSTEAYQGAAGGLDMATLSALDAIAVGATRPDLTILLDIDPRVGMTRAQQRRTSATPGAFVAVDTFEGRALDFHARLRDGFLVIARREPERVRIVDGFQNELALADEIWRVIATRFGLGGG